MNWRPEGWENQRSMYFFNHISQKGDMPCTIEGTPEQLFEAGADAMLEALVSNPNHRIEVLSSRWADEARDWASERNLTIILIPGKEAQ